MSASPHHSIGDSRGTDDECADFADRSRKRMLHLHDIEQRGVLSLCYMI